MADQFEVISPPRLLGRPLYGEGITLTTVDPSDGSPRYRLAVHVVEVELAKAGMRPSMLTVRVWSALLLELKDRVFGAVLTIDEHGMPTLYARAADLKAALALADLGAPLPDLTRPGARF